MVSEMNRKAVLLLFEKIGKHIKKPISVYLIGGGALALKNLKTATIDLDIICTSKKDFDILKEALISLGYKQTDEDFGIRVYETALAVFESEKHNRIDIFVNNICGAMNFSTAMKKRTEVYGKFGKFEVKMASNEDLFLTKCITDRQKDLPDCLALLQVGLDEKVIINECIRQEKKALWRFWVYEQLCRIEENYKVKVPFKNKVLKLCREKWKLKPDNFMHDIKNKKSHL